MVYLFSLLGDTHIFENKFQSERPLRKSLFIWQSSVCPHMGNYIYREESEHAENNNNKKF